MGSGSHTLASGGSILPQTACPPFPWVTPSRAGSWRTNSSMFGPLPSLPTPSPSPSSAQPAVSHAGLGPGSQAMFPRLGHGGGDKGKRSQRLGMESRKQVH